MYQIQFTRRMKRDARRMARRGKDMRKLTQVLFDLSDGKVLPPANKDHPLSGDLRDFRECHIEPDWILIYQRLENELLLVALSTGTHSDMFK